MEIDIHKAIYNLEALVSNAPLSEDERNYHKLSLRALRKIIIEWEKNNAEKDS